MVSGCKRFVTNPSIVMSELTHVVAEVALGQVRSPSRTTALVAIVLVALIWMIVVIGSVEVAMPPPVYSATNLFGGTLVDAVVGSDVPNPSAVEGGERSV
jgi:uncharacterized membrane-anchored protein